MELHYQTTDDLAEVYACMKGLDFPYHYETDFALWEKSWQHDVDGSGKNLFSNLTTVGAWLDGRLTGFVQYGVSAMGFDETGEITHAVSYPIIRNFWFLPGQEEIGGELLDRAVKALSQGGEKIYAFFHYFGMSCYARHGKLFEGFGHIHRLLLEKGFAVEHENVFYASRLTGTEETKVTLRWQERTPGGQQACEFLLDDGTVGGCEVHFLEQKDVAYLRWIYVNSDLCGRGIGSQCMGALKTDLYRKGIRQFDTDTALTNTVAQHYYEKNHFTKQGMTRSYYKP